jgi:hypothetical protein
MHLKKIEFAFYNTNYCMDLTSQNAKKTHPTTAITYTSAAYES